MFLSSLAEKVSGIKHFGCIFVRVTQISVGLICSSAAEFRLGLWDVCTSFVILNQDRAAPRRIKRELWESPETNCG